MVKAIEAAEFLDRFADRANGCFRANGIPGQGKSVFTKFMPRRVDIGPVAANDNYAGTMSDKGAGGGQAETGGAANDDERFVGEGARADRVFSIQWGVKRD